MKNSSIMLSKYQEVNSIIRDMCQNNLVLKEGKTLVEFMERLEGVFKEDIFGEKEPDDKMIGIFRMYFG